MNIINVNMLYSFSFFQSFLEHDFSTVIAYFKDSWKELADFLIENSYDDLITKTMEISSTDGHINLIKALIHKCDTPTFVNTLSNAVHFGHLHIVIYMIEKHVNDIGGDITINIDLTDFRSTKCNRLTMLSYLINKRVICDLFLCRFTLKYLFQYNDFELFIYMDKSIDIKFHIEDLIRYAVKYYNECNMRYLVSFNHINTSHTNLLEKYAKQYGKSHKIAKIFG